MFSFFKKEKIRGCTEGMTEEEKNNMFFSLSNLVAEDPMFFEEQYKDLTFLEQSEFNKYVLSDKFRSDKALIAVATELKKLLKK